jgi:anti-sigma factor RsiW
MRCDAVRGLLDLYMDSDLPEEAVQQVERHLLKCPACAFEVRTLEQTRAMLRAAVTPVEASPAFRERAVARLTTALADRLKPVPEMVVGRQWALPLLKEE